MSRILTIFPSKGQQKWDPLMYLDSSTINKEELSNILFPTKDSELIHETLSSYPDYIQAMFRVLFKIKKLIFFLYSTII